MTPPIPLSRSSLSPRQPVISDTQGSVVWCWPLPVRSSAVSAGHDVATVWGKVLSSAGMKATPRRRSVGEITPAIIFAAPEGYGRRARSKQGEARGVGGIES